MKKLLLLILLGMSILINAQINILSDSSYTINCGDTKNIKVNNTRIYFNGYWDDWCIKDYYTNEIVYSGFWKYDNYVFLKNGKYKLISIYGVHCCEGAMEIKPIYGSGGIKLVDFNQKLDTVFSIVDSINYVWSPLENIIDTNGQSPIIFPNTSTKYFLKALDKNNSIIAIDSIIFNVNPLTLNSGADKAIICGGKVQFDNPITNYTGLGVLTYTWSPSNGLDSAKLTQPTAEVTANSDFALQVSTPNGCIAKDTVKVTVNQLTVNSGADKSIICGGKVQFDNPITNYTGSGILTYAWLPSEGLSAANIDQPTAEITTDRTFTLSVSTPNGCIAKDSVKVTINPLTVNTGADKSIICGGSVQFDNPITNYTGSGILTYAWLPSEGLSAANIAQPTAEITTDRTFTLSVSTSNGCIAKDSVKVTVNPLTASVNDVNVSCGNTAQLNVTTNYAGLGSLTYNWSPSTGLSAVDISNPVATLITPTGYSVEVQTPNGCTATDNVNIGIFVIAFNPSICMVTVNDSDKNVIVWQKEQNIAIDSFFVYRESSTQTGQYDLIGKLSYSAIGVFTDTTSNARVQSNKYKISVKDICGFVTEKSSEHKTMHLTINKGAGNNWNLIWEQYVGLSVSSYKIYRGTTKANLALIGTSSGSNTTFTDETALAGDVYYQIEVILPQACSNLKSTSYVSSHSNIISSADATTGIASNSNTELFIYPNPANDKLYIKNVKSSKSIAFIYDLQGKLALSKQIDTNPIDISNLTKGIYTVKLVYSGNVFINKLIKE